MAENKKVSSVSFFNSRLTSVISISLVLFLLGLILLIGMLGNKLSVYVKENLSFSIVLKDKENAEELGCSSFYKINRVYIERASCERVGRRTGRESGNLLRL